MNTYIAVNDMLNITNDDGSDVYSFMAGGMFDYFLAGGSGYSQSFAPTPNLEAFFISQSFPLILSMLDFNEDFVELALLPMQILIFKEYEGDVATEIEEAVDESINTAKKINDKSGGRKGFDAYEKDKSGITSSKQSKDEFLKELLEQRKKGVLKGALQGWAFGRYGPAGAIMAGWVYDGKVSGAAVVDVVTGTLTHKATQILTEAITKGLKIGSNWGSFGIGMLVGSIIEEAFEVATGLDRNFGFGGELVGVDDVHGAFYEESYGFIEGIKNMFSRRDIVRLTDEQGNLKGYSDKTGSYRYTNMPTTADIITGRAKFGRLESERIGKSVSEKIRDRFYDRIGKLAEGKERLSQRAIDESKGKTGGLSDSYFEGIRNDVKKELEKLKNNKEKDRQKEGMANKMMDKTRDRSSRSGISKHGRK
ncbi:hypothetical protein [Campylobacter sp. RM16188]|uniref:hypothetical protein n=1 Tax=Campylobacter sp. RM16188 TaxID=1705725 RepID=UPI0015545125|nr:hypothetical protein [Campylobacter sp. RM16188]